MKLMTDRFALVEVPEPRWAFLLGKLRTDLRAKSIWFHGRASAGLSLRMLLSDGSLCLVLYRLMSALRRWRLGPLAAAVYKLNAFLTGAVVGRGAEFGPGLVVLHSVGLVVNTAVKAGANAVLESGVVIGAEKGQSPTFGDRVFLGAGAKVIGGVRVGNDVRVGANAVVLDDLPDAVTAAGIPAKVVKARTGAR